MSHDRPNFFAGPYLERRAELRDDENWIQAARGDATTRYLLGRGSEQLLRTGPEPAIAFLEGDAPQLAAVRPRDLILLGWFRGARVVLVDLPQDTAVELPPDSRFEELRPLAPVLDAEHAGLLAYARALSTWRARQRFCGACGAPTVVSHAGHCLVCPDPACAQQYFPRIDPAIIVLVSDGERALLGRQASWPRRRVSTLAGFVEPGESLEDAVAREVAEETGVLVHNVRYHSSQPWPFPSSLMLGFLASAAPGSQIRLSGELEDARWYARAQVTSGEALAPPTQSISWRLIETWLQGGC